MKDKPDIQGFLEGAEETKRTVNYSEPHPRVQKIFRMRWDLSIALKNKAAALSALEDRRVTETEIIEAALKAYLDR